MAGLPLELQRVQRELEERGRAAGLDFWEVLFELVNLRQMNELAGFGGFPVRYPHWRWGMEYDALSKGTEYGLSRIYEMVINSRPAYGYLLDSNGPVEQKMVIAHVLAHVDFFKNNFFFSQSERKMVDVMANHAARVRRYAARYGLAKVEGFIDTCLSLETLIDPMEPFVRRRRGDGAGREEVPESPLQIPRLRAKPYMERYINPPEHLERERRRLERGRDQPRRVPEQPERDVLLFLLEHAPLERWELDILDMIRTEARYFVPQRQTKVLNEGWAAYWHSALLTGGALEASEVVDYADRHAMLLATAPMRLNPYKLGLELLRDIEHRWDRGQFGKDWEECEDMEARRSWNRRLGLGRRKLFEVRRLHNDVTFLDEFLTEEFGRRSRLFTFAYHERAGQWQIESREFHRVKQRLLFQFTNFGDPFVHVVDGNFENRGELLLRHEHEGVDLRLDHARDTLAALERLWRRPVNLLTRVGGKGKMLRCQGQEHSERAAEGA